MTADRSRPPSSFDPAALAAASDALASALHALAAHDQAERASRTAARATLREKARTGRLKPLRALSADRPPSVPVAEGTGPLVAPEMLEDLAAAAIAQLPTGDLS